MTADGSARSRTGGARDVWGYLLFSHGWTWAFWGVNVVGRLDAFGFPGVAFTVLGGAGPLLGGVGMTWATYGRAGLTDLWRRLVEVRRPGLRWLAVAALLPPAFLLATAAVALLFGLSTDPVDAAELTGLLSDPAALLPYAGFVLLLGPLPEEIGWRGYLLDRFQVRWSALASGLLVGVVWASWHAPLFAMPGYYDSLDFQPDPVLFASSIVVGSVVYTWLYDNTARSVLGAVVYHFAVNFTGQTVELVGGTEPLEFAVRVAFVAVLVLALGGTHLRREGTRPLPPPDDAKYDPADGRARRPETAE
jgi:membrane protease YdiL (CAAX protease family)